MRRLFLVLATLLAATLVGTACADVTSSAVEVNDESFDRSEVTDFFTDIAGEIEDDVANADLIGSGAGTMQADVVASVLNVMITNEIFRQHLETQGVDVTDDDVANIASTAQLTGYATFDDVFIEFLARQQLVDPAVAQDLILDAEVEVDPRWGTWESGQVIPNYVELAEPS